MDRCVPLRHPGESRDPLVPLRVVASTWLARRRRVVAPAGESLWCSHNFAARSERTPAARPFAGPNESNQSKGPDTTLLYRFGYKLRPVKAMLWTSRTPAAISSPLGSLRIAAGAANAWSRGEARRVWCSSPPFGRAEQRRALRGAHERASTSDFGRLFERSGRRPRSEFCPTRNDRAAQGSPCAARAEEAGVVFCPSFCRYKKRVACRGETPARPHAMNKSHYAKRHHPGFPPSQERRPTPAAHQRRFLRTSMRL